MEIKLPDGRGKLTPYQIIGKPITPTRSRPAFNRVAYAAAHVVADPLLGKDPSGSPAIDWDLTLAYRTHLLDLGFSIAEAMDTSQRGMGLDWPSAFELIRRSLEHTGDRKNLIASGCGTDQLAPLHASSLDDVVKAYLEQLHSIQKVGGGIILMASRALTRVATSSADYVKVYKRVIAEADRPVILHWLGEMFDPALKGYWGSDNFEDALETALQVIEDNASKVDGFKISLLDDHKEVLMRNRLPKSVKMYTGDDFNYPTLIAGDSSGYSHALLGIFDAIAPVASAALAALARGDMVAYNALFEPTVPLSRLIFRSPTQYYKTGIVFLAWLNGHQNHFIMVNGAQAMRPLPYFADIFRLADTAGLLSKPELAAERMKQLMKMHGI